MSKQGKRLYEFGPYRLLPAERRLLRDGRPVALAPKAFETLVALVERGGRLVKKDELLNEVWAGTSVEESNVAQNVFTLRRVLGRDEDGGQYIETVPKVGYRFLAPVRVSEDFGGEFLEPGQEAWNGQESAAPAGDTPASHESAASAPDSASGAAARPEPGPETDSAVTLPPAASGAGVSEAAASAPRATRQGWRPVRLLAPVALALALVGTGVVLARLFLGAPRQAPPAANTMSRLMSGRVIWSAAVSPDGRYVAHVVENAGQTSIWVRQVATTTDLHVIPPDSRALYWGLTFSRDGEYLYYAKHAQGETLATLYRVAALGGSSRKVVADISSPVTTSPDGKRIAFIRDTPAGESVLMIADADGANARRLAVRRRPDEAFSSTPRGGPSWSPDGQTIATGVISLKGGYHGEVVTISVSDGAQRQLGARRWYQVAQVAWLSDGSGLLAAARESSVAQIWHVSYPDGAARKVTNDFTDYHGVSLTADSRTLVTVQFERPSTLVFVPEKPPSASRRTTTGLDEGFYGLSWTPDGRLAYASEAGGNLDIWLVGEDGATAEQLTNDPHPDSTPSVSPDGRSIVFVSSRGGGIQHVWRMDIDGGNQRRLTDRALEGTPSFTPDGRWVVYAAAGSGIFKVPSEGGEPVPIYEGYAHTPSVSPDGSLIACFYRGHKLDAPDKIALLPIEGGPPVKIFDEPEDLSSSAVRWTADGRALVYVGTRGGVSNLWTLPLDGAQPRALTDFASELIFNFAWSRDNRQLALARGNTAEHVVLVGDFR